MTIVPTNVYSSLTLPPGGGVRQNTTEIDTSLLDYSTGSIVARLTSGLTAPNPGQIVRIYYGFSQTQLSLSTAAEELEDEIRVLRVRTPDSASESRTNWVGPLPLVGRYLYLWTTHPPIGFACTLNVVLNNFNSQVGLTTPGVQNDSLTQVSTSNPGTLWAAFPNLPCRKLSVFNDTGTALTLRINSSVSTLPLAPGIGVSLNVANASLVEVKRTDNSNTQVTVKAIVSNT